MATLPPDPKYNEYRNNPAIADVVIDPNNPNRLYFTNARGYGSGWGVAEWAVNNPRRGGNTGWGVVEAGSSTAQKPQWVLSAFQVEQSPKGDASYNPLGNSVYTQLTGKPVPTGGVYYGGSAGKVAYETPAPAAPLPPALDEWGKSPDDPSSPSYKGVGPYDYVKSTGMPIQDSPVLGTMGQAVDIPANATNIKTTIVGNEKTFDYVLPQPTRQQELAKQEVFNKFLDAMQGTETTPISIVGGITKEGKLTTLDTPIKVAEIKTFTQPAIQTPRESKILGFIPSPFTGLDIQASDAIYGSFLPKGATREQFDAVMLATSDVGARMGIPGLGLGLGYGFMKPILDQPITEAAVFAATFGIGSVLGMGSSAVTSAVSRGAMSAQTAAAIRTGANIAGISIGAIGAAAGGYSIATSKHPTVTAGEIFLDTAIMGAGLYLGMTTKIKAPDFTTRNYLSERGSIGEKLRFVDESAVKMEDPFEKAWEKKSWEEKPWENQWGLKQATKTPDFVPDELTTKLPQATKLKMIDINEVIYSSPDTRVAFPKQTTAAKLVFDTPKNPTVYYGETPWLEKPWENPWKPDKEGASQNQLGTRVSSIPKNPTIQKLMLSYEQLDLVTWTPTKTPTKQVNTLKLALGYSSERTATDQITGVNLKQMQIQPQMLSYMPVQIQPQITKMGLVQEQKLGLIQEQKLDLIQEQKLGLIQEQKLDLITSVITPTITTLITPLITPLISIPGFPSGGEKPRRRRRRSAYNYFTERVPVWKPVEVVTGTGKRKKPKSMSTASIFGSSGMAPIGKVNQMIIGGSKPRKGARK